MNDKFYALPREKQKRIINAGFSVFAKNTYKKSPVNEIALEAGISKSLLFFYFKNKKELYLFLLKTVEEITNKALKESGAYEGEDIFDIMYKGLMTKARLMKAYPDMSRFSLKAYYEKDPDLSREIGKIVSPYTRIETYKALPPMDPKKFKDGIDLNMMYRDIFLASEGFFWRIEQGDNFSEDEFVSEYKKLIDFWKSVYLKEEGWKCT